MGPALCLCVCLGQVPVFTVFAAVFLPSVGVCPCAIRSRTLPLCVLGPSACFHLFCGCFFLPSVGGLSLCEKVPHFAFVCAWAKCLFSLFLRLFFCHLWGCVLVREGPALCLCVCLGQVPVFIVFAAVFLPSVGAVLVREGPALCLCVCLCQVPVFIVFASVFLPSVGVCPCARRSRTLPLCVLGPSACFHCFCGCFFCR